MFIKTDDTKVLKTASKILKSEIKVLNINNIFDNNLVDMETTRGEEAYSYSISIDNNLVVPKGYNLIKSEFYENDIFKYEYQNENKDYIVVTNELKSGVLHLESLKINEIEVYVYANAITKQEAQKILSKLKEMGVDITIGTNYAIVNKSEND